MRNRKLASGIPPHLAIVLISAMTLFMGCTTDKSTTDNSQETKVKPTNTIVVADNISKDSSPITVTKSPPVTTAPTPNIEATVEALVQEKLETALAEQATKLTALSDPPKMSGLEVLTRFDNYLHETVNGKLRNLTNETQVIDTDCGPFSQPRQIGCDDYFWNSGRNEYLETSLLVAIIRSRVEPIYEGKGTWVITIYPEDSDHWAQTKADYG
jgi:hypothetical protein